MRYVLLILSGLITSIGLIPQVHSEEPTAVDTPQPAISIGEMRIQTMPAMSYLSTPAETTFPNMAEPVGNGFNRVFAAVTESKLVLARPTMLVYQDNPHFNPSKKFKMEIGVIVSDDAKIEAADDLTIRKTEPFQCASILYTGTVNEQGRAYQKLIPAMRAAGLKPTGEEREMCLYWEGTESSRNVFMMMIGIE